MRNTRLTCLLWGMLSCAFCILHSALGPAAEATPRGDPGSAEDVQDVVFLQPSRPLLVRLHLHVDGKPYPLRWKEYLTRWFRFLDRDEDGFLDRREAERAPDPAALERLMSNPSSYGSIGAPDFGTFDRNRDNRVSLEEFLRYYRSSSGGPVRIAPEFNQQAQSTQQNALTDALYALLDRNKDSKLSRTELAAAATILHRYDQDDDDVLTFQELQAAIPAPPAAPASKVPARLAEPTKEPAIPFLLVPREDAPRRLDVRLPFVREILKRYDKDDNKRLSRTETSMPREVFDRLDNNKDNELDTFELLRWILVSPDAELVVRLGRLEEGQDAIESMGRKNAALEKKAPHTLTHVNADHHLNLIAAPDMARATAQSIRQTLMQQFQAADRQGKGYVSKKQLETPPIGALKSILLVADRDSDDCLDQKELDAWIDLATSGLNCQISLAVAGSHRSLFSLLDANQDGRLGVREVANPWQQLSRFAHDGEGGLARGKVPVQHQVVINPGAPNYQAGQIGTMAVLSSPRGPTWFRKMDRNGDGDVSPREFLGSPADFRRLDRDGDGLISLAEAQQADAELRKK